MSDEREAPLSVRGIGEMFKGLGRKLAAGEAGALAQAGSEWGGHLGIYSLSRNIRITQKCSSATAARTGQSVPERIT